VLVEHASVIRILLADRQEIFREGLKRLLESEPGFVVVGGAGTPGEVMQLVDTLDPDVLLLDLTLQGSGSLEILKTLATKPRRVRTIALTAGIEDEVLKAAVRHGARGAIRKQSATSLLFKSIRTVVEDDSWMCPDPAVVEAGDAAGRSSRGTVEVQAKRLRLTRREMDIVSAVAAGESNRGIAQRLSLSEDTVKHHVSHVFDKLGVFSRLELAIFAFNHDLVADIAQLFR
jgi:two-component system, NarL family, nitrate/nitrite response regulator NarL